MVVATAIGGGGVPAFLDHPMQEAEARKRAQNENQLRKYIKGMDKKAKSLIGLYYKVEVLARYRLIYLDFIN